jgi:hypothetical protein
VDGIQVHKVITVSETSEAMYGSTTLSALATLGDYSPVMSPCILPFLVVGFQVEKVTAVGRSKSNNVWI